MSSPAAFPRSLPGYVAPSSVHFSAENKNAGNFKYKAASPLPSKTSLFGRRRNQAQHHTPDPQTRLRTSCVAGLYRGKGHRVRCGEGGGGGCSGQEPIGGERNGGLSLVEKYGFSLAGLLLGEEKPPLRVLFLWLGWVGRSGRGQGPGHTPGLLPSFSHHHPTHPRGRTPARPVAGDAPRGSALSPISVGLRKCSSKGTHHCSHLARLQHPCPGPGLSPLQEAGGASTQASRPPGLLQCTSRLQGEAFKVSRPLFVPIS